MAKIDPQAAYNLACNYYNEAKQIISELCRECRRVIPEYSFEKSMRAFDLILQSTLYQAALYDGYLAPNELHFLEDITEYGDVLSILSQHAGRKFRWSDLVSLPPKDKVAMGKLLHGLAEKAATEFAMYFAMVDALIVEKDYFGKLSKIVSSIAVSFAAIDGDDISSQNLDSNAVREMLTSMNEFSALLETKWKQIMQETYQVRQNEAHAPQAPQGSLKANYLKKTN